MWLIVACLLLAAVQLLVRITYEWLTAHLSWEAFDKYATSSTATAVGAIGAATIAATAVGLTLAHNKNVEANKTWWETFEWAAERAVPSKKETEALPYRTSLDILSPLMDSDLRGLRFTKASKKSWALRTQACGSIVELVNQRYATEKNADASSTGNGPESVEADTSDFEAAKSFIRSHPDSRASRILATTHYEKLFITQLGSFLPGDGSVELITSPVDIVSYIRNRANGRAISSAIPDVLLVKGDQVVAVEIKQISNFTANHLRQQLNSADRIARGLDGSAGIPTLFVLNHPIPTEMLDRSRLTNSLHVLYWDGNNAISNRILEKTVKNLLGI